MGKADKYTISLKSLSEGTHSYEYTLDHTFFSEIDSPEIQNGDVNIGLMLRRTGDTFELHFDIKGHIVIPCDRCLDDMELPVETEDTLYVKFGEEYSEEGENLIVVPEAEGTINLAWYMYECIALTIPLKHTHPEGMCNPEMETLLKAHSAASDEISGDEETYTEMAHPKRRQSKTRTAKRRTHDKAVAPTMVVCPNCGAWHIYHTVCGECGYYRGKLAIEKEAAI